MAYSSKNPFFKKNLSTISVLNNPVDLLSRWSVKLGIVAYQKYISPHKGYRCAHRALHGSWSCSEYVKRMVDRYGVRKGFKLAILRFQACEEAHHHIKIYGIAQKDTSTDLLGQSLTAIVSPRMGKQTTKPAKRGGDTKDDDVACCCGKVDTNPFNGCGSLNSQLNLRWLLTNLTKF